MVAAPTSTRILGPPLPKVGDARGPPVPDPAPSGEAPRERQTPRGVADPPQARPTWEQLIKRPRPTSKDEWAAFWGPISALNADLGDDVPAKEAMIAFVTTVLGDKHDKIQELQALGQEEILFGAWL